MTATAKPRWDSKEEKKLLKLYDEGKSYSQIAKSLGRSESSIANKLNKIKHTKAFKGNPKQVDAIVKVDVQPALVTEADLAEEQASNMFMYAGWGLAALAGFALGLIVA